MAKTKRTMSAEATTAPRRRTVTSGGVPLAVLEEGDDARPTLILVHGYPDTHRVWDDVAQELAARHHVVRYDVRGVGASGAPRALRDYRLPLLAADLRAVAEAVSPGEPVHVVGHDWGSIQSWEAVTEPGAERWIASYTSISGPYLDHAGHWCRQRMLRPTPRNLRQLVVQLTHSWYIWAYHLPLLGRAVWRSGLAERWARVLEKTESVSPRPGHPHATMADDAVRGIKLYRANMLPRLLRPRPRRTQVPVQLIALTQDRFVTVELSEGLERWVPNLHRRSLDATHWSSLLEQGLDVADLVEEFVADASVTNAP